ncbi:MAG: hypothetical protein DRJ29_14565 [Bacteroidetes bacterium]|nr:MAG: hypothetical protein DRJ29_14565 [Bacteroidota bacterium]
MKKSFVNPVILLTLIASLLFVSSCEESTEVVEADLIGAWDIGQASVDIKVGPLSLLDFLISTLQFGQEAAKELVDQITSEFLEIGGGTVTFNVDYSYLMSRSDFEESGTWNLEGNKLYLNISDETVNEDPLTVESLNSSAAVVAWEQEQEIDLGEGTSPFNAIIIIELNLTKQ